MQIKFLYKTLRNYHNYLFPKVRPSFMGDPKIHSTFLVDKMLCHNSFPKFFLIFITLKVKQSHHLNFINLKIFLFLSQKIPRFLIFVFLFNYDKKKIIFLTFFFLKFYLWWAIKNNVEIVFYIAFHSNFSQFFFCFREEKLQLGYCVKRVPDNFKCGFLLFA